MPRRRPRRIATELVRPEFPVVAMLVISFLLFSSYIAVVSNHPDEGILPLRPLQEGRHPDFFDKLENRLIFIVAVVPGPNGTIGKITIQERDWAVGGVIGAGDPVGEGIDRYRSELQKRKSAHPGRTSRIILEVGDGILYQSFVRLLDAAIQAGFEDVDALPADPRKQ
jgi:hypothetical protein